MMKHPRTLNPRPESPSPHLDFITDRIAVGNQRSLDRPLLKQLGITGVLNVAISLNPDPMVFKSTIEYQKVGLNDSMNNKPETLRAAILMVDQLLDRHEKILVNCQAGHSRSVSVVAMYLHLYEGWNWDTALNHTKITRRSGGPVKGMRQLAELFLSQA